jgi:hypothetical protein
MPQYTLPPKSRSENGSEDIKPIRHHPYLLDITPVGFFLCQRVKLELAVFLLSGQLKGEPGGGYPNVTKDKFAATICQLIELYEKCDFFNSD